ncbi:MAG: LysE family translocator [Geminicoccaceae bacterium]
MPSTELLLAFAAATLLFAYMPGPALLYTAAQTVARGRRAGLMAALGIHVGGYAHVIAATTGLSAIFHAVPTLYLVVKLAGAGYLIWLGIGLIRTKEQPLTPATAVSAKSARRAFAESVAVELLNPKVALFFIAFLPQFVDPAAAFPIWAQLLLLGVIVNLTFSSADLVCVVLASSVIDRLRRSGSAQRLARRAGGLILVSLGAHLALQRN